MKPPRALVLLKSGRRLDLLDPDPEAWTDQDLAIGLSRTYRWAGYSAWDLPLSVAQHSLTVLALREMEGPLTAREALRELLHDATEALIGGIDPIFPIKPYLGDGFRALDQRLQAAVDQRYQLPPWSQDDYARHKQADRLAAACEALHVVGCSPEEIETHLALEIEPLDEDPLYPPRGMKDWQPWPPRLAEQIFSIRLTQLLERAASEKKLTRLSQAFSRLPPRARRPFKYPLTGRSLTDTYVFVTAHDGSAALEGVIVDGERDEDGAFDLEAEFTIFTTGEELIRCNGWMCHVEIL